MVPSDNQPPARENDPVARALRGFGPVGLIAIAVVLAGNFIVTPLSALFALAWARVSRTPWRGLGFVRPKNWTLTILGGLGFGVVLKLVMKAIVMPLLGAPEINQAFHFLVGNSGALPEMLYVILVTAAFGEEMLYRGYAFERLGKLFGSSATAKTFIVLITATWFGLAHYPLQGMMGVQQAAIVGLVFGAIFAVTRALPFLMFAHAGFDLIALAIIYYDLETKVAHFFFR
jgi:membrane protease YdiL (CAAX protease family)